MFVKSARKLWNRKKKEIKINESQKYMDFYFPVKKEIPNKKDNGRKNALSKKKQI